MHAQTHRLKQAGVAVTIVIAAAMALTACSAAAAVSGVHFDKTVAKCVRFSV